MRETCSCSALLLFGERGCCQQIAALGGGNLSPCERDDLGFAGLLRGGVVTPVEQPRNDASAANGHGHDGRQDRKSTRLNSSHSQISYAVFCLKKKKKKKK